MNGAYRNREISAFKGRIGSLDASTVNSDEVSCSTLVVDGKRYGAGELAACSGGGRGPVPGAIDTSEFCTRADQEAACKLLVQASDDRANAIEAKLSAIEKQMQVALEQTREAVNQRQRSASEGDLIKIERNASKSGKFWYVAGERVAANKLCVSDGSGRRFVAETSTVAQVLQKLANELDSLHQKIAQKESGGASSVV